MKLMTTKLMTTFASSLALVLASCSEDQEASDSASAEKQEDLSAILLETAPTDPLEIAEIRKSAQPGETVTFTGELIGDEVIFSDNLAVMRVGDPNKIAPCPPEEGCKTPWDACCDLPEVKKAAIVSVQVVDENGKVIKTGLKGLGGMQEMGTVTVTGEVAEGSNAERMVVNASGIFVQPKSS